MTGAEFLERLMGELEALPERDREQVRQYYEELLCDATEDGQDISDVTARFGEPRAAAEQILAEYGTLAPPGEHEARGDGPRRLAPHGPVRTVEIDLQDFLVELEIVDTPLPSVEFFDLLRWDEVTVEEAEGRFRLTQRYRKFLSFGLLFTRRRAVVRIPRAFDGEVELLVRNGALHARGEGALRRLSFRAKNGAVKFDGLRAGEISLTANNGAVRLREVTAGRLEVAASNGAISAERCAVARASLTTRNGSITVRALSGEDVRLETSNGAIRGSLCGRREEYIVDAGTSLGKCNLINGGFGARRLYARTANGAVHLVFEE